MPIDESPESQEVSNKYISPFIGTGSGLKKSRPWTHEEKTLNKSLFMTQNFHTLMGQNSVYSETNNSQFTLEKARITPDITSELSLATHDRSLEKMSQIFSQSIDSDENRSPSIKESTLENDGLETKINPRRLSQFARPSIEGQNIPGLNANIIGIIENLALDNDGGKIRSKRRNKSINFKPPISGNCSLIKHNTCNEAFSNTITNKSESVVFH